MIMANNKKLAVKITTGGTGKLVVKIKILS
jgi:hypothetical protein